MQALTRHRDWIARKVEERRESWARLRQGEVYFRGKAYRLTLDPAAAAPVVLGAKEIRIQAAAEAEAWPLLRAWYRQEAERLLRERLNRFRGEMGVPEHPMDLKEWKRRWGECQPQEALRFNWRLVLLPREILDYVVVHELAHLLEPGHGARFWHRVEQVLPDYSERRQWLNRYGTPFLLWRLGEKES
jgi:predicted metal-dependent hydrolase